LASESSTRAQDIRTSLWHQILNGNAFITLQVILSSADVNVEGRDSVATVRGEEEYLEKETIAANKDIDVEED
ncbi:hypothetical protein Tco_1402634, partial [Tanacetum coccineum]